jgi:thymidine kinase
MELLKHNAEKCGYLKVLLGPMFSGKTTELMRIYNNHKSCDIPCCIINHTSDTRYHKEKVGNHNGVLLPCYNYEKLIDSIELVTLYDIFLINEGQFFEDLYDVVNILVNMHKKTVYVCGLDGDFKRRKFGSILDIVPLADDIVKLKAICKKCKKKPAIFTHRLSKEQEQTVIGSSNYVSLCRSCYNMNMSTTPPIRCSPVNISDNTSV